MAGGRQTYGIVAVGTSYGGVAALQELLPGLAPELPVPVVLVQHRGKEQGTGLCEFLRRHCRLPLAEPDDKEELRAGRVYLAPRDYHLLVEGTHFALSVDAPVAFARPSVDVLFESVADAYRDRAVGVVLTGANRDGARGLARIKSFGGLAVVQEPGEAESPAMPRAAIESARVDHVAPLRAIAPLLNGLWRPAAEESADAG